MAPMGHVHPPWFPIKAVVGFTVTPKLGWTICVVHVLGHVFPHLPVSAAQLHGAMKANS